MLRKKFFVVKKQAEKAADKVMKTADTKYNIKPAATAPIKTKKDRAIQQINSTTTSKKG